MTDRDPSRSGKADELDDPTYLSRPSNEIERPSTDSTTSDDHGIAMSRVPTHHDDPAALERIATHRSLAEETVGRRISTHRSITRRRTRPLPEFGAGKPYPPMLPASDDYVVEFDGPDDPMHAQNWPLSKKYVASFTMTLLEKRKAPV
ncbi:MAG: hypothetical protein IMZ46_01995 [Acidobacteria bacterium]|nr:hypothetical protein [Acidobacteriota bacterium]